MAYRVEFTSDAKEDLRSVKSDRARALIRRALGRLEREGPCIGVRLRGAGRRRFCRISVPEHAKNTWRIVYQWPPPEGDADDLIWVWVVREHAEQPEEDVYLWLDVLLQRGGTVEPWSATEPRRRCCDESRGELTERIQRRSRVAVKGSSAMVIRSHRDVR
jgi:hypothetical protein